VNLQRNNVVSALLSSHLAQNKELSVRGEKYVKSPQKSRKDLVLNGFLIVSLLNFPAPLKYITNILE
jgi:hypothetical protein